MRAGIAAVRMNPYSGRALNEVQRIPEQPEMLALPSAAEDLEEGSAEVSVEGGVDDGIEGAVDITKPGAGTVQPWGHMASQAVGVEDVNQEEWHPADYECP